MQLWAVYSTACYQISFLAKDYIDSADLLKGRDVDVVRYPTTSYSYHYFLRASDVQNKKTSILLDLQNGPGRFLGKEGPKLFFRKILGVRQPCSIQKGGHIYGEKCNPLIRDRTHPVFNPSIGKRQSDNIQLVRRADLKLVHDELDDVTYETFLADLQTLMKEQLDTCGQRRRMGRTTSSSWTLHVQFTPAFLAAGSLLCVAAFVCPKPDEDADPAPEEDPEDPPEAEDCA